MGPVGGALSKKDADQRSLMSLKGVITERSLTELAAMGESCFISIHRLVCRRNTCGSCSTFHSFSCILQFCSPRQSFSGIPRHSVNRRSSLVFRVIAIHYSWSSSLSLHTHSPSITSFSVLRFSLTSLSLFLVSICQG